MQITSRLVRTSARRVGAALVLAACAASAQAAAVVGYVDATSWAASVKGFIQGWSAGAPPALPGTVIDFRPGSFGFPTPTPISGGHYQVQADSVTCVNMGIVLGPPCKTYSAFNFATPITAFGIDLDVLPAGIGDGVSFLVSFLDGTKMEIGTYMHDLSLDLAGTSHGFFGFTSDTAIGLISLITNSAASPFTAHEVASVNRFQYVYRQDEAGGGGGTVPEPASWALALLALLALTALRAVARR